MGRQNFSLHVIKRLGPSGHSLGQPLPRREVAQVRGWHQVLCEQRCRILELDCPTESHGVIALPRGVVEPVDYAQRGVQQRSLTISTPRVIYVPPCERVAEQHERHPASRNYWRGDKAEHYP